ncbi:VOC family protein [Mucilaginibacter mali]|uniref:VOC family protein n=1 Tax=Mucilaginibacter mali TaxID=2740462 RepID=A0A7D4PTH9_9SPHI|nr:VOC family protein [Mucilaginibacter mali]QKJ30008.1 VOC family protein [Mucilaginibacter mali]
MKLRVARHTANLQLLTDFYTRLLSMQVLGSFTGHDGYDGVFLGLPGADWHLEFTATDEAPVHQSDEDDLLVFYPDTAEDYRRLAERFKDEGVAEVTAKNPYWKVNGSTYTDPDGYRVVVVKK